MGDDQFFLRRLAAIRPATSPPRPRPIIIRLDGSGTGVPPPEEVDPPPLDVLVEPPWLEDPHPELPQPELPQPELPQPLTEPRLSDFQVASAGALAATARAARAVRMAHLIGFKIFLPYLSIVFHD